MIALLQRDLRLALRAGGGFGLGLAFFLMVAVLVPLGVGPEGALLARIAPGILWVGALLACLLSLDRMFALDFEDGALDLMAVSPLPLEGVVAMKAWARRAGASALTCIAVRFVSGSSPAALSWKAIVSPSTMLGALMANPSKAARARD